MVKIVQNGGTISRMRPRRVQEPFTEHVDRIAHWAPTVIQYCRKQPFSEIHIIIQGSGVDDMHNLVQRLFRENMLRHNLQPKYLPLP